MLVDVTAYAPSVTGERISRFAGMDDYEFEAQFWIEGPKWKGGLASPADPPEITVEDFFAIDPYGSFVEGLEFEDITTEAQDYLIDMAMDAWEERGGDGGR